MKKLFALFLFMLGILHSINSQRFYVKPIVQYNISIEKQFSPQYFNLYVHYYPQDIQAQTYTQNMSLSSGLKYGLDLGYNINPLLSIELGVKFFNTNKSIKGDSVNTYPIIGNTIWDYTSFCITPKLVLKKSLHKSLFSGKIGPVINIASLKNTISWYDDYSKSYQMDNRISLGYTLAFEYEYIINKKISYTTELGFENTYYTPTKAILANYIYAGNIQQNVYTNTKEIDYSDNINNVTTGYNYPDQKTKQTLKFSSVYVGIGLKYKL